MRADFVSSPKDAEERRQRRFNERHRQQHFENGIGARQQDRLFPTKDKPRDDAINHQINDKITRSRDGVSETPDRKFSSGVSDDAFSVLKSWLGDRKGSFLSDDSRRCSSEFDGSHPSSRNNPMDPSSRPHRLRMPMNNRRRAECFQAKVPNQGKAVKIPFRVGGHAQKMHPESGPVVGYCHVNSQITTQEVDRPIPGAVANRSTVPPRTTPTDGPVARRRIRPSSDCDHRLRVRFPGSDPAVARHQSQSQIPVLTR